MDEQTLKVRLAGDLGRREISDEGHGLSLGVQLAATGRLIGDVVLFLRSAQHSCGQIGYVFHPEVAGHGYATEACAAGPRPRFRQLPGLGFHRVVARMDARNHASERLACRLGMRRETPFRSHARFKNGGLISSSMRCWITNGAPTRWHKRLPRAKT